MNYAGLRRHARAQEIMTPSPSTPTPRRFLVAKRGTQPSQTPTAPPKFHSTPRFGSSSAPRPTPWRKGKEKDVEDVEETVDMGDDSEEGTDLEAEDESGGEEMEGRRGVPLNDSIEIESDEGTPSQNEDEDMDDLQEGSESEVRDENELHPVEPSIPWEESSPVEERQSKRRRVTISPEQELSPLEEHDDHSDANPESEHGSPSPSSTPIHDTLESIHDVQLTQSDAKPLQQPIFHAAPRFKPTETDPTTEGLPAAFSPQRRGQKYISHGLAASLQGWLSDVKGWEGSDRSAEAVLTVTIEEVKPGRRMYLARGRVDGEVRRFVLAGEGKLTGLGRRAVVEVGSRVAVGRPVWDVVLEGETWTVACDWSVV